MLSASWSQRLYLQHQCFHLLRALKILRGRRFLRPIQVLCWWIKVRRSISMVGTGMCPYRRKIRRQPRLLAMTCLEFGNPPQGGGTESNSLVRRNTHRTGSIFCRSRLWGRKRSKPISRDLEPQKFPLRSITIHLISVIQSGSHA